MQAYLLLILVIELLDSSRDQCLSVIMVQAWLDSREGFLPWLQKDNILLCPSKAKGSHLWDLKSLIPFCGPTLMTSSKLNHISKG